MADPKKPNGDDMDESDHGEALAKTFQELDGESGVAGAPSESEEPEDFPE